LIQKPGETGFFDRSFWVELIGVGIATPFFYFPDRFPPWGPLVGGLLVATSWAWRRYRLGYWIVRTPADWALALLVLLLPLAVWVAPFGLRTAYAYPRSLIIAWNLAFFSTIVIATAALFGTRWEVKVPLLTAWLDQLPHPLRNAFSGAQEGFSPNQVAGTLLYVYALALVLLWMEVRQRRWTRVLVLAGACTIMGVVMLATQSRAGFAGLMTSIAILLLWPHIWGRWLLAAGIVVALASLLLLPVRDVLVAVDDTTKVQGIYGSLSIAGRLEIWSRALEALQDFPFTGVGLGSFRGIVHEIYPLYLIPADYNIAHAHNFFLQSGLDFGLGGLVAVLAIYCVAAVQCAALWRTPLILFHRQLGAGLLAALFGQAVYGLADAVTFGSKTNVLFWWLLGLVFGITAGIGRTHRD
jgi:putative inorganic carbon (HCO3(-)) transporter